jgi:hypothetical protein
MDEANLKLNLFPLKDKRLMSLFKVHTLIEKKVIFTNQKKILGLSSSDANAE